ncbi:MAG: hypothetical protein M1813_003524 [Trichoglossum hirsutum]|nr:MAG: hypothetical protein M1813_003524 [Trichoglossum hirsutum]
MQSEVLSSPGASTFTENQLALAMMPESPFLYRPLQPDHIRLLCLLPPDPHYKAHLDKRLIECELVHVPLHSASQYEALSYVWGPPDRDVTIHIKAGGLQPRTNALRVTNSLFIALWHLRYASQRRHLWIDQICINQDNTLEKNAQVHRMGEIYSRASSTVVWLGPRDDDAELLQDMYNQLSSLPSRTEDPGGVRMLDQQALAKVIGTSFRDEKHSAMIRRRRHLLERFLGLPWFCRVWVYQEAVVALRVDMIWGNIVLPLDFVTGLVVSVYSIAKSAEDGRWHKRIKNIKGFAPIRTIYYDRKAHKEGKLNLLNVLWHARKHLDTHDDRDYVFAFLAINKYTASISKQCPEVVHSLQDLITPNYEDSVEDVYTDLARAAICSSSSLEVLQYVVPTKSSGRTYSLPTWVPNWADRGFICGSPIFVPGVLNHLSACREKWYPRASMNSNRAELPVLGHTVGCIGAVLQHSFKHTYFCKTLKEAFQLEKLETRLNREVSQLVQNKCKKQPEWFLDNARKTLLQTILADGSFTTNHELCYIIEDLLVVYDNEDGAYPTEGANEETKLRQYLRQTGEVASGKRIFLTEELDIGLGFSTIRAGDIVCILYGSQLPCILRKDDSSQHRYTFVGLCFLHGWMDGERNTRNWDWWRQDPEEFILI